MVSWILVAHILGLLLWVGGLLFTALALSQQTREAAAEARAALSRTQRKFLRGMADPGAALTILAGIAVLSTNSSYYLHAGWLHMKLSFVLLLIVLHGVIGVRSKRFAAGQTVVEPAEARMLVAAVLVVFVLILLATLPGQLYLR